MTTPSTSDTPALTPIVSPAQDHIPVLTTAAALAQFTAQVAAGRGPVALDAERASGFRYSQRAYLVQVRREGAGTALIDPIALPNLVSLNKAFAGSEWILHAADQDLACLAEVGLRPSQLFDTALAARLAGLPRVGLGPLVADMLGLELAKGFGAANWSQRPLPESWLNYAALDVELLIELRNGLAQILREQNKWEWAQQEFAALMAAPLSSPPIDPWRRTSGIHQLRSRRQLAVVQYLWQQRDQLAAQRDIAPHRVLPDSAIINAATALPKSAAELTRLPVFKGPHQRKRSRTWWTAIEQALALPEKQLPPVRLPATGPPPASRWAKIDPAAHQRLTAARAGLTALSQEYQVPVENLVSPRLVRAILWQEPQQVHVEDELTAGGARPWQIELTSPVLQTALQA